jgi:hypothetical protein
MLVWNVRKWKPVLFDAGKTTKDDVTTLTYPQSDDVFVIVFVLVRNFPDELDITNWDILKLNNFFIIFQTNIFFHLYEES